MRENIKRLIQGIKKSKRAQFSQEDLDNAEKKLQIYYKRVKEINMYLKKTKKLDNKAS